jgi:hypothetical protein
VALEDGEEEVYGSEEGNYSHGNFDNPGVDFLPRADSQEEEAD